MSLFIERLKLLRAKHDMTQEELAAAVGLSLRGYQKYEQGEARPGMKALTRLAEVLHTTTDYLSGADSDSSPQFDIGDLTPAERRLVAAIRRGTIVEAVQTFAELTQTGKQPPIASEEALDG